MASKRKSVSKLLKIAYVPASYLKKNRRKTTKRKTSTKKRKTTRRKRRTTKRKQALL